VEIREARPEEYAELGDVVAAAYAPYGSPGDQGWVQHLALVRDVADRAQRTVVLAAVKDGSVLGSATIELFDVIGDDDRELPPDTSFLRMVGVDPRAQGRGVGRALVEEVIRRVRAAGKRTLGLRTTPQMEAAHHLYESLGFVRDSSLDLPLEGDYSLLGYRLDL
jgi:ribosomal protein S18 acetylase RimI-like enzyme